MDTPTHPIRCVPFAQLDRRTIIGASDVAAVLGMSRWHTPLDLYLTKVADQPHILGADQATTTWARMGHRLEKAIREMYQADILSQDQQLVAPHPLIPGDYIGTVVRVDVPWQAASPDAIITGPAATPVDTSGWLWGMDCKNVDRSQAGKWGETGTDEVPDDYALQAHWCMHVTGLSRWDIAALLGGNDLRYYTLHRDEELLALVLPKVEEFWQRVQDRNPPPATAADNETIGKRLRQRTAELLDNPEPIAALIPELLDAREAFDAAKERKDAVEAQVKLAIGEAAGVRGPWGQVTFKAAKDGEETDWEAVAKKLSQLATADHYHQVLAAHTRVKHGSRRFLVKPAAVEVPRV